jgi:hypothetical protein
VPSGGGHNLLFGCPSSSLPPGWEAVSPNYVAAQSASLAEQSESDSPSSIALLKLCGSLSDLQHRPCQCTILRDFANSCLPESGYPKYW